MAGYTRQSLAQILNGEIVSAPPLNAEFNQILSAFNNSTGHKHDGTAAEGPPIDRIADLDQNNLIFVDTSANQINFYVESSAASVGQISIQDGAIVPFTDNDIDLGSSSFEFKDLYIDGTANIDTLATSLIVAEAGTAGAPSITTTGDVDNGLYFNAANQMSYTSGGVAQVTFKDGSIVPVTDNDIDLGASGAEFKDLYIDGTANIDSLVADTADINAGTIDNTIIGATTPAAATFTNLTVSTGSTINFSGATVSNGGTFTTVNISGGSITGITDLAIADGGTGASTASAARTNLGVAIGTNVQAYDAGLQSISGLTTTADQMIYTTSSDTYATASLTSAGRALLDDADASAQRTTLGLGTIATQNANNVTITGGSITGITDLAIADGGTGASTASVARTNLGLAIGTNVQAYDAGLQSISGLTTTADQMIYSTSSDTYATTSLTSAGRALLDDASASAQRTTLGVAIGTNVQAYDAGLQSISGLTTTADQMIYTTSSDTYATTSLTSAGRALLDDASASAQRTTLGLGTLATQNANSVAITGGTIDGAVIGGASAAAITGTTSTATTEFRGPILTSNAASGVAIKTSGGTQFNVAHTASAVNYMQFRGAVSAAGLVYSEVTGSDTNLSIGWISKGTGSHHFYTGTGFTEQFRVGHVASATSYVAAYGSAGGDPIIRATGSGTATLRLETDGTGGIQFRTNNGAQTQFNIAHTASAVNYLQFRGAVSASGLVYSEVSGSDTNLSIGWISKGTGSHHFYTDSGFTEQFRVARTASAVNYLQVTGAATGSGPNLSAVGSDTNINVGITPKGTGIVTSTAAASILSGTAIPAGGTAGAGYRFSSTSNFGVFFGSGAPSLSAAKGSLYLRSDGSGTSDRAYINTDGSTTWTALTTAA